MNKKYFIKTFGCQMNYADSERIAAQLEKSGFLTASSPEKAILVVINSCGVRQTAEDRVFSFIHNIWKNNPGVKIILTGCLANRKDVQKRLANMVDFFFQIKDSKKLLEFLNKEFLNPKIQIRNKFKIQNSKFKISTQNNITNKEDISYLSINPKYTNKHSAFVPVMTGCDNFCSYCVVPYARGREISRPTEEILQEIKSLIKKGYTEIILLGQNVNSYTCRVRTATINFMDLLKKINAISGYFWISFISNHPKDFSEELIKTATQLPKVCEFIHLPLQAGDNQVLARMNRKYTRQEYLKLIPKIKKSFRKYKPDELYSITSDIIVGFPGETKKQFLQSAEVMKKIGFDMVYFGQYSPRPGTSAWKMKDNIKKMEKARREKYLNEILKKTSLANNKKYLGKALEVLIDKSKNGVYFGRTRTMKNVKIISTKKNLIGKIIEVKIIKANIWNLEGICHPADGRP